MIRLAIDVVGGRNPKASEAFCTAAQHLGAQGRTRYELLQELAGILGLYGVEPIGTVRRAIELLKSGKYRR
ncbi:hypothetical protein [Pseudonocardia charpentierae]|uniref:Carboxymuconolactone decarboxylase family protein n=1 Tax=Pseudonocardia charpentierae TaxID=3075545 RepID=A0ABU2NDI1_9PSEU|nr:hypothetical protein [Pseudonocardia sp. DSM 45834]MDT0351657.1 hypothetical protein [Pseudonocardia sp. DSM 45834]